MTVKNLKKEEIQKERQKNSFSEDKENLKKDITETVKTESEYERQSVDLEVLKGNVFPQKYKYSNENLTQIMMQKNKEISTASFYEIDELKQGEHFIKFDNIKFDNRRSLMNIGLGDLMPPDIRKVEVWNKQGKYLGIAKRKSITGGFYYNNSLGRYAQILNGYSFRVVEMDIKIEETIKKEKKEFDTKHQENFKKIELKEKIKTKEVEIDEKSIIYEMAFRYNIDPCFILAVRKQCIENNDIFGFGINFPNANNYINKINMFCRKIQHTMNVSSTKNGKFTISFIKRFANKYIQGKYRKNDFINEVLKKYGKFIGQEFPTIDIQKIFKKEIKKAKTKPKYPKLSEAKIIDEINRIETNGLFDGDADNLEEAINDAKEYLEDEKENIPVLKEKIEKLEKEITSIQQLKAEYDEIVEIRKWKENPEEYPKISKIMGENLLKFIGQKEGFRSNAYLDQAKIPTIGYGFTSVNGKAVQMGDTITREEANEILMKKVKRYQNWRKYVTRKLSPEQEIALTSFEYNLGPNIWTGSAKSIVEDINKGNYIAAMDELLVYIHYTDRETDEKKVSRGLINRRQTERNLFLSGIKLLDLSLEEIEEKEEKAYTALNYALTRRKRRSIGRSLEERIEEQNIERNEEIAEMKKKIEEYEYMTNLLKQGEEIIENKNKQTKEKENHKRRMEIIVSREKTTIKELRKKQKEEFYSWAPFYQEVYNETSYLEENGKIKLSQENINEVNNRSKTGWVLFVDKRNNKAYFFKDGSLYYSTTAGNGKNDNDDFSDKIYQGDKRTPLGEYSLNQYNSGTLKQRAFKVGYPKSIHREQAKQVHKSPGDGIAVHYTGAWKEPQIEEGYDFSLGCVHLSHEDMKWALNTLGNGSRIVILPHIDTIEKNGSDFAAETLERGSWYQNNTSIGVNNRA